MRLIAPSTVGVTSRRKTRVRGVVAMPLIGTEVRLACGEPCFQYESPHKGIYEFKVPICSRPRIRSGATVIGAGVFVHISGKFKSSMEEKEWNLRAK